MINPTHFIALLALLSLLSCSNSEPYCKNEDCLGVPFADGTVDYRVILIGDAGGNIGGMNYDQEIKLAFFAAIKNFSKVLPGRTAVVFLGDNIYSNGLPDPTEKKVKPDKGCDQRACAEKRIDVQIGILKGIQARGIFVPGNHDWDSAGKRGWKRIRNLEQYIDDSRRNKKADVAVIPKQGCPGPVTVPLSGKNVGIALIVLDTQWWLHQHEKPEKDHNPADCKPVTEEEVIQTLKKQIEDSRKENKHVLLVAHHPLITYGKHSGFYNRGDLLNPSRFLSQWIKSTGLAGRQDLNHPIYREMKKKILKAIQESAGEEGAPLIYAAGHDHSLQVTKDKVGNFHLVSGAGSPWKATKAGYGKATLFSHTNKKTGGFMAVDYMRSGKIRLSVIEPRSPDDECKNNSGEECVVFSTWVS
ncbi:MAG: hypothetical protein NPINA01_07940 [Nitrospinaceae bacterium]|nr:MAG: hypothetical protein NPINA01_07940 [Nitrospinaceae bacterium]